ncbi:chemotaxis protein CheB [Rhizobium viscosum]|uniref:Blue-light-activated histidine kinase n=1 Tax=Rhizobium viscosum TaxID=1673 RepID=A0ABR9IT65_RHIVS|nr:CheR family methyltransferase [Rhizobium viscosum]MBE1506388.1 two-component system CheB/CheR fusion protein [Rhizobium viscosum]
MVEANPKFPIVGIGASAGGIPAMEGFFQGLPARCGMAFVIVTHLSPGRESRLHEVIARYTDMEVVLAADRVKVVPETVYVMPENVVLSLHDGVLLVKPLDVNSRERKPIDVFFGELAKDQGEFAVGVILSGGDGDGTLGVKAIKERGGLTVAQIADGSGPRNPDMPQSAISSGLIDLALPAEQMGEKLVAFTRSFDLISLGEADGHKVSDLEQSRERIYAILRNHTGHDFSGYKTKTFLRRVRRRMQVRQLKTIKAYVASLEQDPDEVSRLFSDLLINVTNFFRDVDAFALLETIVIPQLFAGRTATDTVRIWVPGCATGEEVYSIAILMREYMEKLSQVPRVQIFATDIDEPALQIARTARYPEALLEGVSSARKKKYFSSDGASFVASSAIRELCIFSPHSVIRDPPFSRMDLVSCRNLLIYLGPDVQNRVIPTFHYALKPGGYLFLGTSEGIGQHGDLFTTTDKKNRIFQAREHANGHRLPILAGDERYTPFPASAKIEPRGLGGLQLRQAVEAQVLESFAPAHVVVNADGDVVYSSGRTSKFLEVPQGAPSRQLSNMARRDLRLDLRAALRECASSRQRVTKDNIVVDDDDGRVQLVSLAVEPLGNRGSSEALYVVLFQTLGPSQARSEAEHAQRNQEGTADLERELRDTRERLQSTIEEYETALEELKSSNEELVSVNEEAQSSNEELEASKEEMQSLNEELNTINAELNSKVEELDRANNDLKNLFDATQIATIFLDRNLVIRNFTPTASNFFKLRASDVGRPLTELSSNIDYPELNDHIAEVFASGQSRDHHLPRDDQGRHFLGRLLPYRGDNNKIDGVIVTLIDVTTLAEAEEHQKVLISELNHRVKNMLAVTISIATQTLESAASPEEFHAAFVGRLKAMSRTYGLLSREHWKEASVQELISLELTPFGAERITLDGPQYKLNPQRGLALGMVIHELATNAAKYGALSNGEGHIDIRWQLEDRSFVLDWRERGGPAVKEPRADGFGMSLMHGEIGYRLGGEVETNFDPDGLTVSLSFPLN